MRVLAREGSFRHVGSVVLPLCTLGCTPWYMDLGQGHGCKEGPRHAGAMAHGPWCMG